MTIKRPVSLPESARNADYVLEVVIVGSEMLEYTETGTGLHRHCGINYRARVIHSYRGPQTPRVAFTADGVLPLGGHALLLLEDTTKPTSLNAWFEKATLGTDIPMEERQCWERRLPSANVGFYPIVRTESDGYRGSGCDLSRGKPRFRQIWQNP